ncbi:MAG: Fur family transcriptional regulator [Bacillota bacterium]
MNKACMLDRLKMGGYRLTPQRREILNCFGEGGMHFSAEEVHREVRRRYDNISLDTVYRNLNTLRELGIIDALNFEDGKVRYELSRENRHHHHLICLKCGISEELDFCPLEFLDQALLKEKDFAVKRHSFEIYGYCSRCKKAL